MELTRKQAIEELKAILEMDYKNVPLSKAALEMAISSLKTDEAYQLMYEGVDVYDKDTVARMFKELQLEIGKMSDTVVDGRTVTFTCWEGMQKKICNIIQQKINSIKEDKNEI